MLIAVLNISRELKSMKLNVTVYNYIIITHIGIRGLN